MAVDYTLRKYSLAELKAFIDSEEYSKLIDVPISRQRALSYLNNPRADQDDIVMVIAWKAGEIIGYRKVFSDWAFNGGEKVKVGWISGTWVRPDYRRKGVAIELFREIYSDWKGRLMYTNYAPISKKIYDSTELFKTYQTHQGRRFYLKFNLTELLVSRYPALRMVKFLLPLVDRAMNFFLLPFLTDSKMKSRLSYALSVKSGLEGAETDNLFRNSLTNRGQKELDWILKFPWVLQIENPEKSSDSNYAFSDKANPFRQYFCQVQKDDQLVAIVMITIKNRQMKVPYYFLTNNDYSLLADLLFKEGWKNDISHIDVFDENLANEMRLKSMYFAFSSAQERKYMVSKEIFNQLPDSESTKVPDGEGDVVFV